MLKSSASSFGHTFQFSDRAFSRKTLIAIILGVALIAFEVFNFDTTKFALSNLLGEISFAGIMWATILAIAFCAIDFAGLVRLFTPQRGREEPRAVWFLTGAWFLGTIANAIMTWWAVSLTLLSHEFGNEVLGRETLLRYVPIFVAALVWLTRILFIGAFSVAGEDVLGMVREQNNGKTVNRTQSAPNDRPVKAAPPPVRVAGPRPKTAASPVAPKSTPPSLTYEPVDEPAVLSKQANTPPAAPKTSGSTMPNRPASRINNRPPMPGTMTRPSPSGMQAKPRNQV